MESRFTRWCDSFLEGCWLIAILAIPLFFNIHSERVFEPDKITLLRSLALLVAAVWLARWVAAQGWRDVAQWRWSNPAAVWHKPFVLPVVLLIVVYLLATLFSINPRISWAGSYQRLQGTYTTLAYIVIFAAMAAGIRTPEQLRRVVSTAIVASVPIALYGLVQHFGHDPLPWGGDVQSRVAGQMGNAIFIAAYLIMVIPLTLARIVDAFTNILGDEKLAAADVIRSSVYVFTLAIQMLALYWSGSRGPLIGLGVGLFSFTLVLLVSLRDAAGNQGNKARGVLPALLFLVPALIALLLSGPISAAAGPLAAFLFFVGVVGLSVLAIFILVALRRGWAWLWLGWILLTFLVAGWLLLFNIPPMRTAGWRGAPLVGGVLNTLDQWRELPGIGSYGRMLDPSNTTGREKSGRVRVLIWEGVLDLITPHAPLQYPDGQADSFNWLRPFLGYGPESMYTAYNRFYPPELATVEARNASPDRSHNETFDTLVITGLAGLLAWQLLYLTVIHFAFRYLGVVRSRRDSIVLVGLWVAGAALAALIATAMAGPVYLGVAVPTGIILGVIVYLIYYALFGRLEAAPADDLSPHRRPFAADRLLMNALAAAVLAHYVEIHFGIAISATRLYFFAFVALMFALGYRLRRPVVVAEPEVVAAEEPAKSGRRKRRAQHGPATPPAEPASRAGWERLLAPAVLLGLMLGLFGYGFITYALPPDKVITGPADLSVGEIIRQSLLQNVRQNFADWPFVLAMFILSWALGWLVYLGEMIKHGEIRLDAGGRERPGRQRAAAGVFMALVVAGVAARLLVPATTTTAALGISLALIGGLGCAVVAALLWLNRPAARLIGGVAAATLIALAFPVLLAGGIVAGVALIAGGAGALWLLWDGGWRATLLPMAGVVWASLLGGFGFIFLHAINYRSALFYRGGPAAESAVALRALEAQQASGLLTFFYVFVFLCVLLLAFALGRGEGRGRMVRAAAGSGLAYGSLAVALVAAIWLIAQTNMRPVQADMVFKRAKPFDDQATRSAQADTATRQAAWDTAIAIYDAAIDRTPEEDFYYLFLGRAYLERSGITETPAEQVGLLEQAEELLLRAQALNPLNTDHTANLARLNTRWLAAATDGSEQAERVGLAERYYRQALTLSPQNSVIRNELARLILEGRGDCDEALALYDESLAVDPFYLQTHLARADANVLCGSNQDTAVRDEFFRRAATDLEQVVAAAPGNVRAWVQLAEIYRQIGDYERAQSAVDGARANNEPAAMPTAAIDYLAAQVAAGLGRTDEARELAERALTVAGPETAAEIESFLATLDGE
jgi:tetratricopeptide (TPR) repeat protein